jgi:hypothetical protein
VEHSPLFTQNSGDSAARKKKKMEEGRTCGGFEAVLLAVADRRTAWTVVGFSSSYLRFFSFALFSSISVFLVFLLLFLTVQGLLLMTGRMVAAGGGAGGGYAYSNRWFLLLSLLICFHFQDLAMALVVLLLLFLFV